jgi:predicted RNase H-like HicB family nuclease
MRSRTRGLRMKKLYYPALIDKDEDNDFGVRLPDFPGCVSAGASVEEALIGAQEGSPVMSR